jgi:hypothetical protein
MLDEDFGGGGPEGEEPRPTHKVARADIVQLENGEYAIEFEFDDGYTDFAEVGSKETAEFYASAQMGEDIVMGANPLLLNAAKAEMLRQRQKD